PAQQESDGTTDNSNPSPLVTRDTPRPGWPPQTSSPLKGSRRTDEDHVYNELAAIFDSIFDDEKALRDTVTHLQMERNDAAAQAAIKQVSNQATSRGITPSENTRRSVRIDDPKHLTDGKEPKFEHWLSRMKNKLWENTDHYPTERMKIAYIENWTDGDAARHIAPCMEEDHPE
ncbi:hypothetical protein PABG_07855, partial [Paracoccidioides brasiliensis Pb03]